MMKHHLKHKVMMWSNPEGEMLIRMMFMKAYMKDYSSTVHYYGSGRQRKHTPVLYVPAKF